ncbi:MAG: energy transducer TonB [Acidobacteriaceae bacterium]|nr:energy transducer TonB [Acidobacteriaceae bacterium]
MSVADQSALATTARAARVIRLTPQFVNRIGARHLLEIARTAPHSQISGFLYGTVDERLITIQAFRTLIEDTSITVGARLAEVIAKMRAATQTDPEISGLGLVGWFCFASHGGLPETEIDFHNTHFPQASDVALVLKPEDHSQLVAEIYSRSKVPLSGDHYRWASFRIYAEQVAAGPVEVTMQGRSSDEKYLRAFHGPELEKQRTSRWKAPFSRSNNGRVEGDAAARLNGDGNTAVQTVPPVKWTQRLTGREERNGSPGGVPAPPVWTTHGSGADSGDFMDGRHPRNGTRDVFARRTAIPAINRVYAEAPPTVPALLPAYKPGLPWFSSIVVFLLVVVATLAVLAVSKPALMQRVLYSAPLRGLFADGNDLQLKAVPQGDAILLTWNPRSAGVRSAVSGVLHINDSGRQRDVPLDRSQIASGSVVYRKPSRDVTFELILKTAGGTRVAEDARLSDLSMSGVGEGALKEAAKSSESGTVQQGDAMPLRDGTPVPGDANPAASNEGSVTSPDGTEKAEAIAEPYYVPAKPMKQVLPNRHLLAGDGASERADVSIEVGVDSHGRVTDARVLGSDPPASAALLGIALDAAKQWRYRPAMLQGRHVGARERIVFQFRPE